MSSSSDPACGDGAEVPELIEEALDEVAFAMEREVARPRGLTVWPRVLTGVMLRWVSVSTNGLRRMPCRQSRHLGRRSRSAVARSKIMSFDPM